MKLGLGLGFWRCRAPPGARHQEAVEEHDIELAHARGDGVVRQAGRHARALVRLGRRVRRELELHQRRGRAGAQIADVAVRVALRETARAPAVSRCRRAARPAARSRRGRGCARAWRPAPGGIAAALCLL